MAREPESAANAKRLLVGEQDRRSLCSQYEEASRADELTPPVAPCMRPPRPQRVSVSGELRTGAGGLVRIEASPTGVSSYWRAGWGTTVHGSLPPAASPSQHYRYTTRGRLCKLARRRRASCSWERRVCSPNDGGSYMLGREWMCFVGSAKHPGWAAIADRMAAEGANSRFADGPWIFGPCSALLCSALLCSDCWWL